jgi:tetratricopeptide (TPR) repeat protein
MVRLRPPLRARAWFPALALALALGCAGRALADGPALPSLAEVKGITAVRQARADAQAERTRAAAAAYVEQFPQGRYLDEALLALAEAQAALGKAGPAAQTYDRLIETQPDSPLRDQAMVQSLPLLRELGRTDQAYARTEQMAAAYPGSVHAAQARLWKAQTLYDEGNYPAAVETLTRPPPGDELTERERTQRLRLLGLSYWRAGRPQDAQPAFTHYLSREDSAENKAPVLMLAAEGAQSAGHPDEAMGYYQQVIERYPLPAFVPEAQLKRASIYAATALGNTEDEAGQGRLRQAIALYSAYLDGKDARFRAEALQGRARLLALAGRPEEALRDYEQLQAVAPQFGNDPDLLKTRVGLLRQLRRDPEAEALLTNAIQKPGFPPRARQDLVVELAALHYEKKDCVAVEGLLKPLPIFQDAAQRNRAFFLRGFCRYHRGQWQEAATDLEGLVNDPEYQALVVPTLLDAYERAGENSRLVLLTEELLASERVQPDAELLLRLARAYERLGQPERMLDAYRRLAKLDPKLAETAEARVRMGSAEEALGHADAARAHYEAVLAAPVQDTPADREAYLTALERLQPYYVKAGRQTELVALNAKAAAALKDPQAQARVRALQRDAYLDWGQAAARQGQPEDAIARFELARAQTAPEDGEARLVVLAALAGAYSRQNRSDKAQQVYREELARTPPGAARARLVSGMLTQYPEWAGKVTGDTDRETAIRYYEHELTLLPKERAQERYALAMQLDPLYKAQRNHSARAALFGALADAPELASSRNEVQAYRIQILRDWAEDDAAHDRPREAESHYRQALDLVPPGEWRRRYDLTVALGKLQLKRKDYTGLVLAYEDVLPRVKDEALQAGVLNYLGQVYLLWGRDAEAAGNRKSARIRYYRALDYLPEAEAERRAGAALRLAGVLHEDHRDTEAAAVLKDATAKMPAGAPRQEAALGLARLYRDSLNQPQAAQEWLAQADGGDNRPLSLEAGYELAELELKAGANGAGRARLEALSQRALEGSPWQVPILYRLAVLQHQAGDLDKALDNYRVVAGVKSKEARQQYAQAIAQSRRQADELAKYLKLTGGKAGVKIAVPKVGGSR